jgi:hypothetical protein
MKIDNSQVLLTSTHAASSRHEVTERLRAWVGDQRPDFEGREIRPALPDTRVTISAAAKDTQSAEAEAVSDAADAAENDPFLILLKSVIERLTGQRVKVFSGRELQRDIETVKTPDVPDPSRPQRAGWGVEYDYHEVREEQEQTAFSAEGVVRTADGREIRFRIDLAMARAYREETNISLRAGDGVRKDPLVINFGGTAAQLQEGRFNFDLEGDGSAESIPLLGSGSGFLALDINGDGKINDGRELFGPATNEGFQELAAHDSDSNGWIDENDPVFSRLRVWQPVADGPGALTTLAEHNVGALLIGNVATPFALRTAGNAALGDVRTTSLYLTEDGRAGAVQQIDLTA